MYFCLCEHYNDDDDNNEDLNKCFICLNDQKMKSLKYLGLKLYDKSCDCDSLVHQNCLAKWQLLRKSCPICLSPMNKIQIHPSKSKESNLWILKFTKSVLYLFHIYLFIEFYLLFNQTKHLASK